MYDAMYTGLDHDDLRITVFRSTAYTWLAWKKPY